MADDFSSPHPVRLQGNALARALFAALGWRVVINGLPSRQGVLVVYPHTSNWDFVYLIIAKWAVGLPLKFWAKDSLMTIPLLGHWLRWLGAVPVDRNAPHGVVGEMVRTMEQNRARDTFFWLALTPEGTRKWTPGWRSGFYQVALGAGVPLGICSVNFPARQVVVSEFYRLSGDIDADMRHIAQAFQDAIGKHPAQAAPIRLIEK